MRAGKDARVIDGIARGLGSVIRDLHTCGVRNAEGCACRRVAEYDGSCLWPFGVRILVDEHAESFLRVTGLENQPAGGVGVISFLFGRAVDTGVVDRGLSADSTGARNCDDGLCDVFGNRIGR